MKITLLALLKSMEDTLKAIKQSTPPPSYFFTHELQNNGEINVQQIQ